MHHAAHLLGLPVGEDAPSPSAHPPSLPPSLANGAGGVGTMSSAGMGMLNDTDNRYRMNSVGNGEERSSGAARAARVTWETTSLQALITRAYRGCFVLLDPA